MGAVSRTESSFTRLEQPLGRFLLLSWLGIFAGWRKLRRHTQLAPLLSDVHHDVFRRSCHDRGRLRVRSILSAPGTHNLAFVGAPGVEPLLANVSGATPWRASLRHSMLYPAVSRMNHWRQALLVGDLSQQFCQLVTFFKS